MINESARSVRFQFDSLASDIAALLHSHPLFVDPDLAALTEIISRGQRLMLRPGDVLLGQGKASDAAYIVVEGSAFIRIETSYGTVNLTTVFSTDSCR